MAQKGLPDILAAYQPLPGCFDELATSPGRLRTSYSLLADNLEQLGHEELTRRAEQAKRQIRVFGALGATDRSPQRPEFSGIPLIYSEEDWHFLESALDQRARLFRFMLTDLYGERFLLRDRHVPPALLYGNPAFHPVYHGLLESGALDLFTYSADVTRAVDGSWWICGDTCGVTSGLSQALENRIVTSRMLQGTFRDNQVHRLTTFFQTYREKLQSLAYQGRENPRMVLWTGGPDEDEYTKDAYLARYLNITLAEGGDLTVRDNRVMLKTLGGLLPVEVLLRHVRDESCDPLELTSTSVSGVSGLVESIRRNRVAIANPLGTRLLDSPAWMPFLPGICRHFLGEEPLLPSVATWWCGQPEPLQYVLNNLDRLVIRPAFLPSSEPRIQNPQTMSANDRDALIQRILARPEYFVAQQRLEKGTVPIWHQHLMTPLPYRLRCFLLANNQNFTMLPGGCSLAEKNLEDGRRQFFTQDVWVLSSARSDTKDSPAPTARAITLRRSGTDLPSRVADNLFWLGRHVERADSTARLLRCLFRRMSGDDTVSPDILKTLITIIQTQNYISRDTAKALTRALPNTTEPFMIRVLFDDEHPMSLSCTIRELVRLASLLRDRLSDDAWANILELNLRFQRPAVSDEDIEATDVLDLLQQLVPVLAAFSGLASDRMTRTLGWRFQEIGKRMEAAYHLAWLLRSTLSDNKKDQLVLLDALLDTADSMLTYRTRYLADLQSLPVLDLLLTDLTNPRSIAYQLDMIHQHIQALPRVEDVQLQRDQRLALSMLNRVRLADVHQLNERDKFNRRSALGHLLDELIQNLPELSNAISSQYLIHTRLTRQGQLPEGPVPKKAKSKGDA